MKVTEIIGENFTDRSPEYQKLRASYGKPRQPDMMASSEAFEDGKIAARNGQSLDDNPETDPRLADSWESGWYAVMDGPYNREYPG